MTGSVVCSHSHWLPALHEKRTLRIALPLLHAPLLLPLLSLTNPTPHTYANTNSSQLTYLTLTLI